MKAIFQFLIGAILAISALSSSADPQWYNDVYPTNSNSQISLVNQSGGTVTAIRNPTAASVQLNTNTSTRVPSVLVQASATLPVVTIGTTCDPAKETAALSASDRLTILVCPPTGLWTISNRTRLRTATEGSSCDPVVDGNLAVDSAGVTLSCQYGAWKYLGLQPFKNTYLLNLSKGLDTGPVTVSCNAGDILLSITTMACLTAHSGSLEGIISTTNSATLYCDIGNNGIYDGGTLGINCARN